MVEKKKENQKLVSRRDFLVAGGAVMAAGALSACTPKSATETVTSTMAGATNTVTVTSNITGAAATKTVTSTVTGAAQTGGSVTLDLVNPRGVLNVPTKGPSPRLDTLDGKKILLYTNGKATTYLFQDEIERLLKERFPKITVIREGGHFNPGWDRAKEMKAQGVDGVIYGNSD
jgi:hypothetical protein